MHGQRLELARRDNLLMLGVDCIVHLGSDLVWLSKDFWTMLVTHHEVIVLHIYAVTHGHAWQALEVGLIDAHVHWHKLHLWHCVCMHKCALTNTGLIGNFVCSVLITFLLENA